MRPLAVGYVRLQASDPLGVADLLDAEMRVFAHRCGLALADTYTEHADVPVSREGEAFRALVETPRRPHIHTVIIPPLNTSRGSVAYTGPCAPLSRWRPTRTCSS